MASMSVKNRVAMFEHGGGNKEDERINNSTPYERPIKSPATPSRQSSKNPTHPAGSVYMRPATPTGQSLKKPMTPTNVQAFNRPSTPNQKPFNKIEISESPEGNRNSCPWPTEENVIPAPSKDQSSDSNRRYSSPFLPQSHAPAILPQKSPKGRSSLGSIEKHLSENENSPLKHIQNQEARKVTGVAQHKLDFTNQMKHSRYVPATTKPMQKNSKTRAPSPVSNLSKSGSLDENRAPRPTDVSTQRSRALQLAKTRNSYGSGNTKSSTSAKNTNEAENRNTSTDERNNDDTSSSSSHSSKTNNELGSINSQLLSKAKDDIVLPSPNKKSLSGLVSLPGSKTLTETSLVETEEENRTINSAPGEQPRARSNSRAGKLSHALRRASTPDSASEIMDPNITLAHSQPPMPPVRGSRTVSKVSHQEARKALLQAAQKKKEKLDAAKHSEKEQKTPAVLFEQQIPSDSPQTIQSEAHKASGDSSKSQRSTSEAADRLALRAASVLAIKNSSKLLFGGPGAVKSGDAEVMIESVKDTEGSITGSVTSAGSADKRRMDHPAFVARSSPRVPSQANQAFPLVFSENATEKALGKTESTIKPFSEELFSSFRYFKESRPEQNHMNTGNQASLLEGSTIPLTEDLTESVSEHQAQTVVGGHQNSGVERFPQGRPPHPQASASPMSLRSPKNVREAVAGASGSVFQSFDYSTSSPANTDNNTGRFSIDSNDSPFMEQEESLHSTSEHKFDRRYNDGFCAIGQPKYAAPRQMFPNHEGGYLSSLSSNTVSNQSMVSSANEQPQQLPLRGNPLGEMSPGPSMHSGHSFAHSIVSVSPKVETDKNNNDFEYMLSSPSKHSAYEASHFEKATPDGVPPQIDEEEGSEPTVGKSVEGESEPLMELSSEDHISIDNPSETMVNAETTIIPIQTSYSAADAPPGFVFHDDEDTEGSNENSRRKSDPVGMSFDRRCEPNGEEAGKMEENQSIVGNDEGVKEDVQFTSSHSGRPSEKSSSTKGTVSTSLRTGLSSMQNGTSGHTPSKHHVGEDINVGNGSTREGSCSIRTGLSGLQNPSDLEGSASMRSVSASMKGVTAAENDQGDTGVAEPAPSDHLPQDPPQLKSSPVVQAPPKRPQFDTIIEGDGEDEESSGIKPKPETPQNPETNQNPEASASASRPDPPKEITSAIGQKSTATTDTSSRGSGPHPDPGKKKEGTDDSDRAKTLVPSALAPINTQEVRTKEDISVASSPASSRHSGWKMKMPNVIKNVLAKASPRNGNTPNSKRQPNEKTGFSTSEDEEEDIFGGLEDDVAKLLGEPPKNPSSTKNGHGKITAKRSNKQPPTQNKFFHSGHTRKSEPPRALEVKDVPTPSRRSVRSESRSKPIARKKTPENKLTLKGFKKRLTSPMAASNPYSMYSNNDRSGTIVEQEMERVNSDITSSILGAPFQRFGRRPRTPKKEVEDELDDEKAHAKTPKAKTTKKTPSSTKSRSSKKSKTPGVDNQSVAAESKKSKNSKGKETLLDAEDDTKLENDTTLPVEQPKSEEEKEEEPPSMFMNLGCGLSDAFTAVASVCHFGAKDEEPEEKVVVEDDEGGTFISAGSNNTSSHLTELEKRVWNEWDKLDSAFNKPSKPLVETKEEHDKKREVARGKLLDIANSAVSSQMTKEGDQSGASGSYTTGSSTDSGESGESSGISGSRTSSEGQTASSTESRSNFSGSDVASDLFSADTSKMTTTPILLSFSQRSLIEKFTKQLSTIGVEVLKLNRRKQWQVRYFTVSKEQIALIAHEANSKSGAEVAQCPKALLWLKKFNAKHGNYGLSNIDKNGHGGMLLVDLKDIQVSSKQDVENPIPKKLADKFKDSVLVNFEYQFKGEKRQIEFRCKDNDEAQFLCTCMRVIRDLLKREQALRLKTQQAKASKKK